MADQEVRFKLTAEAQGLVDALVSAGKVSEKEAANFAIQWDSAINRQVRAVKKGAKARRKAEQEATKGAIEGFRKFASVAQGDTGRVTSAVLDAMESVQGFSKALGPAGLAVAAVAATTVGLAAAAGTALKVYTQMLGTAREVVKDAEKLERLQINFGITETDVNNVENAGAAMDRVTDAMDAFAVLVASEFADSFVMAVEGLVALNDAGNDLADSWGPLIEKTSTLLNLLNPAGLAWEALSFAMADNVAAANDVAEANRRAAEAVEETRKIVQATTAVRRLGNGAMSEEEKINRRRIEQLAKLRDLASDGAKSEEVFAAFRRINEEAASALEKIEEKNERGREARWKKHQARLAQEKAAYDAAVATLTQLGTVGQDAEMKIARQLDERLTKAQEAFEVTKNETALRIAQDAATADAARQLTEIEDQKAAAAAAAAEAEAQQFAQAIALRQELAEAEMQAREMAANATREAAFSTLGLAELVATRMAEGFEKGTQAQREAAMAAYIISKGLALTQIAMNTAVAATRALAELGPIAGPPAAAAIAAQGVVQAAVVASEPPPSFHLGGTPAGRGSAAQPDVHQAQILANEEVVTAEEQRRRSEMQGAPRLMAVAMGHEVFDRGIQNAMRQPASPFAQAMRRNQRTPGRGSYRGK